jgi:hypothetical protein
MTESMGSEEQTERRRQTPKGIPSFWRYRLLQVFGPLAMFAIGWQVPIYQTQAAVASLAALVAIVGLSSSIRCRRCGWLIWRRAGPLGEFFLFAYA